MTGRPASHGFTLVEMLVAIVIFMLFISTVYGTYYAAHAAITRAEEQEELYQTGRVLLAQLNTELTCLYQPAGASATNYALIGDDSPDTSDALQKDTLTFCTTAHVPPAGQPVGDICQVKYSIGGDNVDEEPGLYVDEDLHLGLEADGETSTHQLLSPLVVGFNCRYLSAGATDWATEWTDPTTLPVAIRIELTLQSKEPNAKPIVLASTANLAMTTAPPAEGGTDVQP